MVLSKERDFSRLIGTCVHSNSAIEAKGLSTKPCIINTKIIMPKIALISDIHGNLPALYAVLKELDKENPDLWVCLGDIVGYGPEPAECLEEVIKREMICVMGNHDGGVNGKVPLEHFRNPNRRVIEITKELISKEQIEWLEQLPLIYKSEEHSFIAVHASPENPEKWEYLESAIKVRSLLGNIPGRFCFSGHTHKPAVVSDTIGITQVKDGYKFMINPGSVGQPRDNDRRASCGILDTDKYTYKNIRVNYNPETVLVKLEKLGFTRQEAERLMLSQKM